MRVPKLATQGALLEGQGGDVHGLTAASWSLRMCSGGTSSSFKPAPGRKKTVKAAPMDRIRKNRLHCWAESQGVFTQQLLAIHLK